VSFLNGDSRDSKFCYECDFDVPMRSRSTITLVVSRVGELTRIRNLETGSTRYCAHRIGFITVDAEDASRRVVTDNVLAGKQTVVNSTAGTSYVVPALAIQGKKGDGNRTFAFDGAEYRKLPAYLDAEFEVAGDSRLVLFTLGFRRQQPPLVDCSVIGRALPHGGQFSSSFQFGCHASIPLGEIDPELTDPHLGSDRGTMRISCTVYGTGGSGIAGGGVHGILVRSDGAGLVEGALLEASPSAGCPTTFRLTDPALGPR
jgi:hypothetical protein